MQSTRIWSIAVLLCAGALYNAQANVSLRNGNFFIGYTDIIYPGGFEPKIERVYNSKTAYLGMFGHGWGNEYEVYLVVGADGSVVVHEYGGGAENRFYPVKDNARDRDAAIEMLVKVALQSGALSGATVAKHKAALRDDAAFRNDEWLKYVRAGKIKARVLPEGTQLVSNRFAYQYITKTKTGYVRTFDSGRTESFNEVGRLVKVTDRNSNWLELNHDAEGKLVQIKDSLGRKIRISYNSRRRVSRLDGENGKFATYQYNDDDELVFSKDVDNNEYRYDYTKDRRHNLSRIGYSDKTTLEIAYFPKEQNENVKSIRDRDGTFTEYEYRNTSDKNNFGVGFKVFGKDRKLLTQSSYEYTIRTASNGERWTYRLISNVDGDTTDTIYNEGTGLPAQIRKGKSVTQFGYDRKGRVTMKDTPSESTRLVYDDRCGKVKRVDRNSKRFKTKSWAEFAYENKCNLEMARNSEKMFVRLVYNNAGQIMSMVDQNKKRLDLRYDENSRPIEIIDPSSGSIRITYQQSGEVKDVQSTAPRHVAQQVTGTFQRLLELVRSAGVTLAP